MADQQTDRPENQGILTRRQMLISGGAAVGSLIILERGGPGGIAAANPPTSIVPGIIERVELPRTLYLRNSIGATRVELVIDAMLRRGHIGRPVTLNAFLSGEEVVAEGQQVGDVFLARGLRSRYRTVAASIIGRRGNLLEIDGPLRQIQLLPDTQAFRSPDGVAKTLSQFAVGDKIVGFAWRDLAHDRFAMARIAPWMVR